jgi:hypothetical protein
MRILLALTLFSLGSSAAQTTSPYPPGTVAPTAWVHALSAVLPLGSDAADECALYVARTERDHVLTLADQAIFDAFAEEVGDARLNASSESLLRDALAGTYDRLASALPTHRRETGTRDFARLLALLTERRGAVHSVRALGTVSEGGNDAATYVRVRFTVGEELIRVKWRGGRLALITRGVLPRVSTRPLRGGAGSADFLGAGRPDVGVCLLRRGAAER